MPLDYKRDNKAIGCVLLGILILFTIGGLVELVAAWAR
jgi:hypothetical protein